MNEVYKQTRAYLDALDRGRAGERCLYDDLSASKEIQEAGLIIRLATEDNHEVPFDVEVLDAEGNILVGIENKDLSATSEGTHIRKISKRRKELYAKEHSIPVILTTVTRRNIESIGWKDGLVNGHTMVFNYDKQTLYDRILQARRPT